MVACAGWSMERSVQTLRFSEGFSQLSNGSVLPSFEPLRSSEGLVFSWALSTILTGWGNDSVFSMKNHWGWVVLSCTAAQAVHFTTPGGTIHMDCTKITRIWTLTGTPDQAIPYSSQSLFCKASDPGSQGPVNVNNEMRNISVLKREMALGFSHNFRVFYWFHGNFWIWQNLLVVPQYPFSPLHKKNF